MDLVVCVKTWNVKRKVLSFLLHYFCHRGLTGAKRYAELGFFNATTNN